MPVADAAGSLTQAEAVARASVGRTVGLESGGDAAAKNPRSSATGPAQFVDETWLEMLRKHRPDLAALPRPEALGLRTDPDLSKAMAERSEEHTSELQSLMRISYAVFCLKKKTRKKKQTP